MSETLTSALVIEAVAQRTELSAGQARAVLEALRDLVTRTLGAGQDVGFSGLAKLKASSAEGAATVTFPSLATNGALAQAAQVGAPLVQQGLAAIFEVMREALLGGRRVFLDDFLSLQVVSEKAKIVKDPESGRRTIQASRNTISFGVSDRLREAVDDAPISFLPSKVFKEAMQHLKTSSLLLVAPKRDFFAETIEFHFQRAHWSVITVTSVAQARSLVEKGGIYLVLLDAGMPDHQSLIEFLKFQRAHSMVPLVLMYPSNVDLNRAEIFRIVGNEQVVQPFEVKQLLDVVEAELARASEEETIFEQEVIFQFPTDDQTIDRANESTARLFEVSGLDEEGQVALSAAFREAVGNASQHGNKHRRDRMIEVLYLLDREKITCSVTDSGEGFDHRNYVVRGREGNAVAAARERHAEGKLGGLGIMLMLKCTDDLRYNDKGNVVTLTKYLDPKKRDNGNP